MVEVYAQVGPVITVLKIVTINQFDGLVQDCSNSSANVLVLLQYCTKPSIWLIWLLMQRVTINHFDGLVSGEKSSIITRECPQHLSRPSTTPGRLLQGCQNNWWHTVLHSWWRHQMETFSALLAICAGNSPVPGEFPTQRPVTRNFIVYFDLRPNKRLSKQL